MSTVAAVLAAARTRLPASEARLLLGHVLGRSTAWLIAHDNELLDEAALLSFASLAARRRGGEPVAYLLGYREFYGREFMVSPSVLIPRPETEILVDLALAEVRIRDRAFLAAAGAEGEGARILDLGTGSGCIAITLALEIPSVQVCAVDASEAALRVAGANAKRMKASLRLVQSDWFGALRGETFDLIVTNPPYVAESDPHLGADDLRHEPPAALASGTDGLDAIRRIIAAAPKYLTPGGQLWLEHGYDQADAVRELLSAAGLGTVEQHRDVAGIVRVSGGRLL
jgi:release factor glutamine methyltransferase